MPLTTVWLSGSMNPRNSPFASRWPGPASTRRLAFWILDNVKEARALFHKVGTEYLLTSEELRAKLVSYYADLYTRLVSKEEPNEKEPDEEWHKVALDVTSKDLPSNLRSYLTLVLRKVAKATRDEFFRKIREAEKRRDQFTKDE